MRRHGVAMGLPQAPGDVRAPLLASAKIGRSSKCGSVDGAPDGPGRAAEDLRAARVG